jgi:protocatechuate 4,5-dioxygenase alpha chain
MMAAKDYDDIPGTFVFDADRSREGYPLNMFCMSLMKKENRESFKAGEAKYLDAFALSPEQREAILKRDYNRMLELGGNIYFTAKLGATDGHSFQHMAAVMTGATQDDYAKMMLGGGRSVEGNRSKSGREPAAKRTANPAPKRAPKSATTSAAVRSGRKPKPRRAPASAKQSALSGKATVVRRPAPKKTVARKPAAKAAVGKATAKPLPKKSGSKRG